MTAFAIYSPKGELLASFDAVEDATYAGRTRWAGQVGWIERRDGLVYRGPGPASVARKPPEPAPDRVTAPPVGPLRVVAPPLAPPAPLCPVWAALRVPATIGELDRMLVRLDREGIGRRLLWLLDHGYVSRERGSGLWRRLDDAGEPPAAGEEVAS